MEGKKKETVFLGFGFVSAQLQGFSNLLRRRSLAKTPKILAPNGYRIFSNALALALGIAIFPDNSSNANAQTNSWTSPTSGNWEDSSWSLGVLPGTNQAILITNTGWKAVAIGPNTAANFPQTLNVGTITISSPTNSYNNLLLNFAGVSSPLIAGSVTLNENSAITLYSSELQVSNMSVGGTFNHDYFSGVSARTLQIGDIGPGTYTMSNGTLTVTSNEVLGGWSYPAGFDQEGGYHLAASLSINGGGEYDLRGGQLGGSVGINGGTLTQSGGDLAPSGLGVSGFYNLLGGTFETGGITVYRGYATQAGGTNSIGSLFVGSLNENNLAQGGYTMSNGVMHVSNATITPYGGLVEDGGTIVITGGLNMPYYFVGPNPGHYISGSFTLNDGMFSAGSITGYGRFTQAGGTNTVAGDLALEMYPANYSLAGGLLSTSNTLIGTLGLSFNQSGGVHMVRNLLRVNSAFSYNMMGGQLVAPSIDVGGSSFIHSGGTVSNSTLLILEPGTWSEKTANTQMGRLQLGGAGAASTLLLASGPCTMHFLASSGEVWSNNSTLQIGNWAGSLNGGDHSHVFFGNGASGLSASQLAKILFRFSQGNYPAGILSSGEIVPQASGPPFYPTNLTARAMSSNRIDLVWLDNAVNETGYGIERSLDGSNFVQIATLAAGATNYSDTGLTPLTHYYYRVRALGSAGDSAYSNIAIASTKLGTPPPIAGMIAWWRAEGTAEDSIGTHDGYVPWAIGYPPGKIGQAFDFPGSGQRVIIPDSPDFVLTNAFSIEGWIYPRQLSSGMVAMRGDARPGLDPWTIHMAHLPGYLSFAIDNDSNEAVEIDAPVQTNQWQHFAATFDTTNGLRLYINGTLMAQTNTTLTPIGLLDPTEQPAIGIGNSGVMSDEFSFNGMLDEISLYSRALSPNEIHEIYDAGSAGKLTVSGTMTIGRLSGGSMQLNFAGAAGHNYEFDVSTDLIHWSPWTTQQNTSGTISITDGTAINYPIRFYRVIPVP